MPVDAPTMITGLLAFVFSIHGGGTAAATISAALAGMGLIYFFISRNKLLPRRIYWL